jgi:short-subunit dehydrogenase
MATYGATKAFVANQGEALQSELVTAGSPIDVTVILPGYIRSEMNEKVEQNTPFMVSTQRGVRSILAAVEARRRKAYAPEWPWRPISWLLKVVPLRFLSKLM